MNPESCPGSLCVGEVRALSDVLRQEGIAKVFCHLLFSMMSLVSATCARQAGDT